MVVGSQRPRPGKHSAQPKSLIRKDFSIYIYNKTSHMYVYASGNALVCSSAVLFFFPFQSIVWVSVVL